MTPAPPGQVPEDDPHPAGPAMYVLTGWPVLAVLVIIAGVGWFYLARSGDWRGPVYAGLATVAVLGGICVRLMTA